MVSISAICCIEKTMYKGDHRTFRLTVTDQSSAVVDLTGCGLVFTVKMNPTQEDPDIQKSTSEGGIDIVDPTHGIAEIGLVPDDTSDLETGAYMFDAS